MILHRKLWLLFAVGLLQFAVCQDINQNASLASFIYDTIQEMIETLSDFYASNILPPISRVNKKNPVAMENQDVGKKPSKPLEGQWKKISKDDPLPEGASVKINLGTGEKMIRVNDSSKQGRKYLEFDGNYTLDELKYGLKAMKETNKNPEVEKSSRKDYRNVDVILEELGAYTITTRIHKNIIEQFLMNYTRSTIADKIRLLVDIEYLVHQYSVAQDFVKLGGIRILHKDFSQIHNDTLQELIAVTFGSAMQGNPFVKEAALKDNLLRAFLYILVHYKDTVLAARSMFALSALVRNYHPAQDYFLALSGFSYLSKILESDSTPIKLKQKIIIFAYDLIQEYAYEEIYDTDPTLQRLYLKRRERFEEALKEGRFCEIVPSLISSNDPIIRDNSVLFMYEMKKICLPKFSRYIENLKSLLSVFEKLIEPEYHNDVIDNGYNKIYDKLLNLIIFLEDARRDEL